MAMNIVLVHPEIPQNTGNIARTCAATGAVLHLIEPLGFSLDDRYLKRAGLDYWHLMQYHVYPDYGAFLERNRPERYFLATTKAGKAYDEVRYRLRDEGPAGDAAEQGVRPYRADSDEGGGAEPEPVELRGHRAVRGAAAERVCRPAGNRTADRTERGTRRVAGLRIGGETDMAVFRRKTPEEPIPEEAFEYEPQAYDTQAYVPQAPQATQAYAPQAYEPEGEYGPDNDPDYEQDAFYDDGFDELTDEDEVYEPEETPEDRREKYRTAAGVGNIFGIVAGVVVILLLVALLLRMGHFVEEDMTRNFALFQTNF